MATLLRWAARGAGLGISLFVLFFAAAEGAHLVHATLTARERLMFAAIAVMMAGAAVGWRWEGAGGALICAAFLVLCAGYGRLVHGPFLVFPLAGVLYLLSWWWAGSGVGRPVSGAP